MDTINKEFLRYIKETVKFIINDYNSIFDIPLDNYIPILKSISRKILDEFEGYIEAKSIHLRWGKSDDNESYYDDTLGISFPFSKPTLNDKIHDITLIFIRSFGRQRAVVRFNTDNDPIKFEYDSSDTDESNRKFKEWLNS